MNTANNSRSKETKNNLKKTLLALMAEGKSADAVSVKEICERCGINRSTFYAHYSVPGDILKEIENSTLKDTQKYISSLGADEKEYTKSLLSYIKKNQETFRVLFSNTSNTDFCSRLITQVFPIFHQIELAPFQKHLFSYIQVYTIDGAKAIISSWINNSCAENEEKISDLIIVLSKRVIDTAFSYHG